MEQQDGPSTTGPPPRVPLWARGVAVLLRLWARSLRWEAPEDALIEGVIASGGVLACWHGELLPLMLAHRDRGIVVLVSRSRDGDRLSGLLHALGYRCIRGSSSRGGRAAGLAVARAVGQGHGVAIAADGPRGPRHQAAPGATRLAALGGGSLVAVRAAGQGPRLGSWDGAWLPLPGSRVRLGALPVSPHRTLEHALEQAALPPELRDPDPEAPPAAELSAPSAP